MSEQSASYRSRLKQVGPPAGRALVGFDGFIDSLYRVVKSREGATKHPYVDIPEFAAEVGRRAGLSAGFEVERLSIRAGGNAPLMAMGLAALGVQTTCAAAMGFPTVDAAFTAVSQTGLDLFTLSPAASTVALEFGDGKIMFNDPLPFEELDWQRLVANVGLDRLRAEFAQASLLALVDWANLPHGRSLWQGMLEDVLERETAAPRKRHLFFDLADIARRGDAETADLLGLLARFKAHGTVTLGLNENEAFQMAEKLSLGSGSDISKLGRELLRCAKVDTLVIHPRDKALVFSGANQWDVPGRVVSQPLISTGGGDHFNSGFCLGLMSGLPLEQCAEAAVRVSGLYVEKGRSPKFEELVA